ncbi:AraC family transcriptional regulator [Marivirga lumbricoides]|uniref:AraC family transcriptional regulator n=1 Tax=Marivirga lumbricoides TaxID=1046115 RepID=A0ABQ1LCF6_9BACT|nr:AraC family transcriptional regulator [Marivirga lumbricoides]
MLNIETYKPERFSDLIERIWIADNFEKEVNLVIPPNQYVNLVFPLNSSKFNRNQIRINTPQIEGISTQKTVLTYPANTKLIGIRFFAFGLYPFVKLQGKELINNSIPYPPDTEKIKKTIDFPMDECDTNKIDKLYNLLSELFCQKSYDDISPIMNFYNQFRWEDETHTIEDYCKKSETNYTSLNRKFTKIVGLSPKGFERLIKFRKSLCSLIDSEDSLTSIGANSGYFDQAHFIREFKIFLNQTPSNYKALIKQTDKQSQIINYNFKLF